MRVGKQTVELTYAGIQEIKLPVGAQILSAKAQHGKIAIWALGEFSDDAAFLTRRILFTETFASLPDGGTSLVFIDTVLFDNGHHVLHVFEELGR